VTIRFAVEPKDVPPDKAARRLGLDPERFQALLPRLLARGFPPSDPDTGNYDLDAIDEWRARRHRPILPQAANQPHNSGLVKARLERMRG
jgi:hypothetical protein